MRNWQDEICLWARIKMFVCRFVVLTEFCHRCGKRQELVWTAPDEMWCEVTELSGGNGVLCPECFDNAAKDKGLWLRWVPTED